METIIYTLDAEQSSFVVQAYASGLLGGFGHNPVIAIPEFSGEARFRADSPEQSSVTVRIATASLTVSEDISEKDRREMERIMRNDVLETVRYPEIVFSSYGLQAGRTGRGMYQMNVGGRLDFHGCSHSVAVPCRVVVGEDGVQARGEFSLRQTDYGIRLVSFAAGTLKLKDELTFHFDIFGARQR
jgi:polyisoprenoid-binding protein YceI